MTPMQPPRQVDLSRWADGDDEDDVAEQVAGEQADAMAAIEERGAPEP